MMGGLMMTEAREMTRMIRKIGAAAVLAVAAGICFSQSAGIGSAGSSGMQTNSHAASGKMPGSVGSDSPMDNMTSPFPDSTRQKRNDERQRRLVSDTQRLLALTSQLKAEVANSGAESMSPEMLKQMEEIEKLAKSVKDKMRD
jgi:hypothetical protein